MIRILGLAVLAAMLSLTAEAQAQCQCGKQHGHGVSSHRPQQVGFFRQAIFGSRSSSTSAQWSARHQDPYEFYDLSNRYPKYYGAFHYSHFNNIGLPHGERGLRGNGLYWGPW